MRVSGLKCAFNWNIQTSDRQSRAWSTFNRPLNIRNWTKHWKMNDLQQKEPDNIRPSDYSLQRLQSLLKLITASVKLLVIIPILDRLKRLNQSKLAVNHSFQSVQRCLIETGRDFHLIHDPSLSTAHEMSGRVSYRSTLMANPASAPTLRVTMYKAEPLGEMMVYFPVKTDSPRCQ